MIDHVGDESHVFRFEVMLQILLLGNSCPAPQRVGYRHALRGDTGVVAFLIVINFLFFLPLAETVPKVELRQKPARRKNAGANCDKPQKEIKMNMTSGIRPLLELALRVTPRYQQRSSCHSLPGAP